MMRYLVLAILLAGLCGAMGAYASEDGPDSYYPSQDALDDGAELSPGDMEDVPDASADSASKGKSADGKGSTSSAGKSGKKGGAAADADENNGGEESSGAVSESSAEEDGAAKDGQDAEKSGKRALGTIPMECHVTPSLAPDVPLEGEVKKNGNLWRKAGAARNARGSYVVIVGKVVDEDCVPIDNALIRLWQADAKGKYEQDYKTQSEWEERDADFDPNFGYSGRAETNNVGQFRFLTIFPGTKEKDKDIAPHVNLEITQPDFEPVTTMLYFNKHPKNAEDASLKKLSEDEQALVVAKGRPIDDAHEGRVYELLITLRGINKYRRY